MYSVTSEWWISEVWYAHRQRPFGRFCRSKLFWKDSRHHPRQGWISESHFITCYCFGFSTRVGSVHLRNDTCGILKLIRVNPELFRQIFQLSKNKLTADLLDYIFLPLFIPEGSNKRVNEESVVFNFNQMLENVENVKVVEDHSNHFPFWHLNVYNWCCEVPTIGFSPCTTYTACSSIMIQLWKGSCLSIPVPNVFDNTNFWKNVCPRKFRKIVDFLNA